MGITSQVKCRRCERSYSALRGKCPYCGARKTPQSGRTPVSTSQAAAKPGEPAASRAASNTRWQFAFGAILLAAVILAVIVLVATSLNPDAVSKTSPPASQTLENVTPSPPPTPSPTPTPTEPPVTSITISYFGQERTEFLSYVGSETPLSATVFPVGIEATVTWRSDNESICTVSQDGVVTGVGKGTTKIYAEAGGISKSCIVYIA